MRTVQVPIFDEFKGYAFTGHKYIKIKNKPDSKDVNKITRLLPGIPQGGVGREPLADLLKDGFKPVASFYDTRQNTRKFKNWNVYISP